MISFLQTPLWAEMNHHYNGLEPHTIEHAGISCLFGYDARQALWRSFGGPVIEKRACPEEALYIFLKALLEMAKKKGIYQIDFKSLFPLRSWSKDVEQAFLRCGFRHIPWSTLILDLQMSQDQLLQSFSHAARKGIRKASSFNLKAERCATFESYFYEFLGPYYHLLNRPLKSTKFYQDGWALDTQHVYNYWVLKDAQDMSLGFLGTYRWAGVATEIMSGVTPAALSRKIPVQDFLHWETIQFHQAAGDLSYDLAGFNPRLDASEKEKNIKIFKEKWGSSVYDVSSYYLDTRSFFRKVVNKIKRQIIRG